MMRLLSLLALVACGPHITPPPLTPPPAASSTVARGAYLAGRLALNAGDAAAATRHLRRAERFDPHPQVLATLGEALLCSGDPSGAVPYLERAIAAGAPGHHTLIDAHLRADDPAAARAVLVSWKTDLTIEQRFRRAQRRLLLDDAPGAREDLEAVLRQRPTPQALRLHTAAARHAGTVVAALRLLEELQQTRPTDTAIASERLRLARSAADADAAADALVVLIPTGPPELRAERACLLLTQGERAAARAEIMAARLNGLDAVTDALLRSAFAEALTDSGARGVCLHRLRASAGLP